MLPVVFTILQFLLISIFLGSFFIWIFKLTVRVISLFYQSNYLSFNGILYIQFLHICSAKPKYQQLLVTNRWHHSAFSQDGQRKCEVYVPSASSISKRGRLSIDCYFNIMKVINKDFGQLFFYCRDFHGLCYLFFSWVRQISCKFCKCISSWQKGSCGKFKQLWYNSEIDEWRTLREGNYRWHLKKKK